jgi:VWFA-related protein
MIRMAPSCLIVLSLLGSLVAGAAQQPSSPVSPNSQENQVPGDYAIRQSVSLVVLHASVFDRGGQFVPGLTQESFRVYEDKIEQTISVFHREDIPVTLGLIIDNSSSMRDKRRFVNSAALTLVGASNPQDEVFVVNFNDDFYLDTPGDFTDDIAELQAALERIETIGSTSFHDAMIGSLDHLQKGHMDKRILIAITDGADNSSRSTLKQVLQQAQRSEAIVYAIGVFSRDDLTYGRGELKRAKSALTDIAKATGGAAFFPDSAEETESVCLQIAQEIRQQYTIAYYPTNSVQDGTFRAIRVTPVASHGTGELVVRTRAGYYAAGPNRDYAETRSRK